jgi:multiple sugar transport system permease protein
MSRGLKEAIIFIAPLALFVAFLILLPVIGTLWNSFWRDISFSTRRFAAFENYLRLFSDGQFWQASFFTITFAIVSVSLEMVFGTITALVLNENHRLRGMMRGIALIPWAIPGVIGARIWQLVYRFDYGPANWLLQRMDISPVNWLGTSHGAFAALVLADVWRTTPFVAIIILAGLQTIPDDLLKQAQIDGAGIFRRFFSITIPLLRPIIVVALLFRTIDALRVFDAVYVITGGGPGGSTNTLSLYGYKFFLLGDFGYGSAVSIILFIIAFAFALAYLKIGRFRMR